MTYDEAVAWLFRQTRAGGPRGLERVRAVLERLGRPEGRFSAVHVVGTNGKGSVVAFLEAILRAAGKRYGATTSPHLVDFRERIRTYRGLIPREAVVEFVGWARRQSFPERVAFFDYSTALAFRHFAEAGVELAVVEAGVGGRLDATRVLPRVEAVVLTNVGEDHLEALGGSLEAVARDKAGAARPGVPLVTAAEGPPLGVVREVAQGVGAPLHVLGDGDALFDLPCPPALPGAFQRANARLAVATARLLGLPEETIARGIARAQHPGRLQRVEWRGLELTLDGAHNPPAARALAQELGAYHLVYGGFPRKDYRQVLEILLPKARSVRYARAGEGALDAAALGAVHGAPFFDDPLEALEDARRAAGGQEPVLVTGSLYLVGEVLRRLGSAPYQA
ncbi:Folylpolyglutamate synthase [Calidithermus terrae]|uniref:Folylpolyglutamate synthase n=1 Tax=Calidithermus terrae TaxID=1408545 RepID=A0A399EMH3_9DEIN|nr:folylpolyglutamate synthase/dihydrofolate synthase family protein [Calidithermus terrae]RIH84836.1 Folylpolyglutamate synthase [Calidithermus terrae]